MTGATGEDHAGGGYLPGVKHLHSGKVRDLYAIGDDLLLVVASDRISAFDHVLTTPIPDKGVILTQLSVWWFDKLAAVVPNHLVTADVTEYPAELAAHANLLRGRSMLCRRLDMVPVECVARGYLTGSGFAEYWNPDTGAGLGARPQSWTCLAAVVSGAEPGPATQT